MVKLSENKARQGRLGRPVLIVLLVSLALAMIVWWGVELYGTAIAPNEGDTQTGVETQSAPPAAD